MKSTYEQRWGHPRTRKANGSARKAARRLAAIERQKIYDALSLEEKIQRAMSRPGNSKKELARLQRLASLTTHAADICHTCGECGHDLQIVRPGKYQCINQKCGSCR